jgi:serine/threonine-protein kinase
LGDRLLLTLFPEMGTDAVKGKTLANYRITEKIGEGGMGEVWKALDTTLGREVAIKILPESFSSDANRRARFEREARLLASLNHSGIATIHGLHEIEGVCFLAMEFAPGFDLAQLLERGPLPLDEVLHVAANIADALEAAHNKGIIHRDLKPANIVPGDDNSVKVLDFGLAKMHGAGDEKSESDLSNSPTVISEGTVAGVILGTAGYMSPEQARGRPVDKRTDVWAFGCVLYEMLTGNAPFKGDTISDTIGAVLHVEPDLAQLPPATPPAVRTLIRRCLEKDRKKRLRDAGDALLVIEEVLQGGDETDVRVAPARRRSIVPAILVTAVVSAAAGFFVMKSMQPAPDPPEVRKFAIPADGLRPRFTGGAYPSPNGKYIGYVTRQKIMVWQLDNLDIHEIDPGEPFGSTPLFWSPDSKFIGYQREEKLWKVIATGGESILICSLPESGEIIHGSWGDDGLIVLTSWRGGMFSVSAEGGTPDTVLTAREEAVIDFHRVMHLPDGSLVYDLHPVDRDLGNVGIKRLANGEKQLLISGFVGNATYSSTGHLLYTERVPGLGSRLMAAPYSVSDGQVTGEPFRVADGAWGPFVTDDGLLVYMKSEGEVYWQLVWLDRKGKVIEKVGELSDDIRHPRLSPDERYVALSKSVDDERDIWIVDLMSKTERRLTFGDESGTATEPERRPAWSPDGRDIVFARGQNLQYKLYVLRANGSGSERLLFDGAGAHFSSDGHYLAIDVHRLDGNEDIFLAKLGENGSIYGVEASVPLLATDLLETASEISPDGRFLAFEAGDGDERNIFLTQFPSGEGRWQVSTGGGYDPRWSADGDKIYFWTREGDMTEVPIATTPVVVVGQATTLFNEDVSDVSLFRSYSVSRDGRFLAVQRIAPEGDEHKYLIVVVENWYEEFRDR